MIQSSTDDSQRLFGQVADLQTKRQTTMHQNRYFVEFCWFIEFTWIFAIFEQRPTNPSTDRPTDGQSLLWRDTMSLDYGPNFGPFYGACTRARMCIRKFFRFGFHNKIQKQYLKLRSQALFGFSLFLILYPICLSACLSVFLFFWLSVCLSVCLSICLFVSLSVCLSVYTLIFIFFLSQQNKSK